MRPRTLGHSIGRDEHLVTFESPGDPVPDGDGGYSATWTPLVPPTWYVSIRPATAKDQEDLVAGTVITHVTHVVHGRFHPGVTTQSRMVFNGQTYTITAVDNLELRGREMQLIAELQTPDVVS